ncbi:hypothetical protein B7R22_04360 [Subtercola boreus]|uniref:DUF3515 domain-containing protein n=1 Tax=Subtercola boreus TaxID=120213 RepID=A0A3E0W275_9MICO|nr:DUF3515 family protein [Subtercola boreus]RFA16100.1 hypothetical protein B7R22_04360 [Subtercola boreus]
MPPRKRLLVPGALAAALVVAAVTGCAPTVALDPAAGATDPGCAEVMVRLPLTVADESSRETNAQATAAWGSPASVLLRCGVAEYGPTTLPCLDIGTTTGQTGQSIQWIEDDSEKPSYTYTTFGRNPATQVIVDSTAVSATTVLIDLQSAIASIPQTSVCTNPDNVLGTGGTATGGATGGATDPATGGATGGATAPIPDPATSAPADTGAPFVIETTPPTPAG